MFEAEKRGREYLAARGMSDRIIDFKNTDITAESTALALDVDVDRICKGLAFKGKNGNAIVIIASGHSRVDNARFRDVFGFRPSMLSPEKTEELIGHIGDDQSVLPERDSHALSRHIHQKTHERNCLPRDRRRRFGGRADSRRA